MNINENNTTTIHVLWVNMDVELNKLSSYNVEKWSDKLKVDNNLHC